MADGYLPPVVVRLVAETAEAIAGLERFGAALTAIGERATAAGAEVDRAMTGVAASTTRVDAAFTEAGAAADRFAAQATAAEERAGAAAEGASAKVVAGKEREAAAARTEAEAEAKSAEMAAIASEKRQIAIDRQIASFEKMNYANDIEVRNAQAGAAKVGAAYEAQAAKVEASQARVSAAMDSTTAKAGASGAASSRSLGMIGLAAGGVAVETVKMASTFDRSMEQLVTMAGQPQPVVDSLKQKVLALGATTGQGPDKLADALYHLTSSGMNTDQAMHALESSAKLATMGISDLDTTAYALAGVMSAAPKDIHNTDQAVALMAATVGQGDMKMQDLANSIKSGLLPTMIQAGMGMRDYGATIATVADNSMPAEMAANRLRTAVLMMEAPTKAGTAALKDLGMTSDEMGKDMRQGGMLQAITDLKAHMENLKPAAGDVKMSLEQVNQASQEFHDQMIQDGASADDAAKATDKYRKTLEATGTSGQRAIKDIDKAFGGSRSAGTMLLLTDEAGKLQQKYNDIGDSVTQEQRFQENWNRTAEQTAVKAQQAKAGLQALGIQIGEELMPVVNAALGAVARFGAALTQGSVPAKVLADVIGGVLVAVIVAYTAKMVVAVAQTVAWAATGVASFMVGVARMVAGWGVLGESAQTWARTSRATAAEADAATKTAAEEMAAAWQVALDKMVASTRAAGPELAAAAGADGEAAGAAESEGMAAGLAAGKAKVATAGAETAAAGGAAAKTGFLGKFGKVVGGVGVLGLTIMLADSFLPDRLNVEKNVGDLVDHINHAITGEALSPATQSMDAETRKWSNSIRSALGLAKLYSDDGMQRINTGITQGANDTATNFGKGVAPIPSEVHDTINKAGGEFDRASQRFVPPVQAAVNGVGESVKKLPDITRPAFDKFYDDSHNSLFHLAQDGDVQGQAIEHAVANHIIGMSSTATGTVAQMKDKIGADFDAAHAKVTGDASAIDRDAGAYFAHFAKTVDDKTAQARKSTQDNMDAAQAHVAKGGQNMVQDAQKWADQFGKTITNGGQKARDGMNKAQDDMRAHTAKSAADQIVMVRDGLTGQLKAETVGMQQLVDRHQRGLDDIQHRNRDGLAGLNRDANTYWQLYPKPVAPALVQANADVSRGLDNTNKTNQTGWGNMLTSTDKGAKDVQTRVGKMPGEFSDAVRPIPDNMKTAGGAAMDGYKGGFDQKSPGVLQGIKDWFSGQIREIKGILGIASPSTVFNSIGVDMMTGLWNGLRSMMDQIGRQVQDWINGTVAAIRATLGIRSPSTVMHEVGQHFMQGFCNGIVSKHQTVVSAVSNVNDAVVAKLKQSQLQSRDIGWAMMQGWIENGGDIQDQLALNSIQGGGGSQHSGGHRNRWGCWVCGQDSHKPIDCPNKSSVLTLTRANSGIGVQDSTVQAGVTNNFTIQGTVLDHQGMFQAMQEAALRSGQRNSFTGGFGSPR